MEGCKFKIGDIIATKYDVELWALGRESTHRASEIRSVSERAEGFFVSTGNRGSIPVCDVIPESDIKAHAIKFLAEKISVIAGS